MKDNTDRNRTSPFAFTGNKFEFRAVGASASTAFPITLLNAAVADAFSDLSSKIKNKGKTSQGIEATILEVIRETIRETHSIRFEGNNYSEEWVQEAAKRGLPNLRKTPEALAQIATPQSRDLMSRLGIFSEAEMVSRFHVRLEIYLKNMTIEADTLRSMIDTQILPAAYLYHGQLATAVAAAKAAGIAAPQTEAANHLSEVMSVLQAKRALLETELKKMESLKNEEAKAKAFASEVSKVMAEIRSASDKLESIVSDEFWPLPKYREMLFLS